MTWKIRRASSSDATQLSAIALAAKRHWGYPQACLDAWRDELTVTPGFIRNEAVFIALGSTGEIVGFYALCITGTSSELGHFWVRPEVMRCGVGRALFKHALAQARTAGCQVLHIDADPHAAGFYERMGAELVGAVPAQIDDQPRVRPQYRLSLSAT